MELRWYQRAAIDALYDYFSHATGDPLLVLPTGSGKSVIQAAFQQEVMARWPNQRILLLSHVRELLEQNAEKLLAFWPDAPLGIYSAGMGKRVSSMPLTIASIQSVHSRPALIGRQDLIIIDECFPAGTRIATPRGDVPIESLRVGDTVEHALGCGRIEAISNRPTTELISLELCDGRTITCTPNHRLFSESGWVEAALVEEGRRLLGIEDVRELRGDLQTVDQAGCGGRDGLLHDSRSLGSTALLLSLLLEEAGEPDGRSRRTGTDDGDVEAHRTSTQHPRGQWHRVDASADCDACDAWSRVDPGVSGANEDREGQRVSDLLQTGPGEPRADGCHRARRQDAHGHQEGRGREEGRGALGVRVARVTRAKLGCALDVFNLQVSGHPSYFADGVLAHNCHLIAPRAETMYRKFLAAMRSINPAVKVIGMTATPYRLDSGYLHQGEGALFTDIAYELPIVNLIREGFLCTLVSKGAARKIDLSDVHIRGGEYAADDLARAVHQDGFTAEAIDEVCRYGATRDSWLLFTPSVEYAHEVCELLTARMVRAAVLSGETPKDERARIIADFRARRIRALVNCNVLTTGFDAPAVDLVVLLRSTKSTALYVQMIGRGMRTSPGKPNCMVLDFGGNIERHGPIDDLRVSTRSAGKGDGLPPPAKECPECNTIVSVFARACPECGHAWVLGEKPPHEAAASEAAILTADIEPEWMEVQSAWYLRHEKSDRPTSLRVEYNCGLRMICEWVCIEHKGYARGQAEKWFAARGMATPASVDEAIAMEDQIPLPTRVLVRRDGKFDRVINYEFGARNEHAGASGDPLDDLNDDDIFGSLEDSRAA